MDSGFEQVWVHFSFNMQLYEIATSRKSCFPIQRQDEYFYLTKHLKARK